MNSFLHFKFLPLSLRMVYTMTLLVLGTGYLFAMIQVFEVHAGRDGNPSLSANDLRIAYSGQSGGTRLESALHGPMKSMLPNEERQVILDWINKDDASKESYDARVKPIMDTRCIMCHSAAANPHLPSLTSHDEVSKLIVKDEGMSIATLVRVSHIHLFGITFIFFIVSLIFAHSYLRPVWIKCVVIIVPFLTILMDIASWYLTKMWPAFAWMVIGSGALMGLSFAIQWFTSMYQMWFYKPPKELLECGGQLPIMGDGSIKCQPYRE
ncbi:hypothetical protein F8A87_03685 [Betaproteobacteria bacterium SCN2]|jgi:hypothetical protein|nr:hypothetical protein F8A87_03685 [Betaproteobacteria bacterium SCN2]